MQIKFNQGCLFIQNHLGLRFISVVEKDLLNVLSAEEFYGSSDLTWMCMLQKQPLEVFFEKKVFLKNFTKFVGKHLCQSLVFNKLVGPRPATLLKKRLWRRCSPLNFVKFLRTLFLQNTSDDCFSCLLVLSSLSTLVNPLTTSVPITQKQFN